MQSNQGSVFLQVSEKGAFWESPCLMTSWNSATVPAMKQTVTADTVPKERTNHQTRLSAFYRGKHVYKCTVCTYPRTTRTLGLPFKSKQCVKLSNSRVTEEKALEQNCFSDDFTRIYSEKSLIQSESTASQINFMVLKHLKSIRLPNNNWITYFFSNFLI